MAELPEFIYGCQSHSCVIEKPKGQGNNGPCMCGERMLRIYIRHLKSKTFIDTRTVKPLECYSCGEKIKYDGERPECYCNDCDDESVNQHKLGETT